MAKNGASRRVVVNTDDITFGVGIASGIANGLTVRIVAGGGFKTYHVRLGVLGGVVFSAAGSMISGLVEPTKGRLITQKLAETYAGFLYHIVCQMTRSATSPL